MKTKICLAFMCLFSIALQAVNVSVVVTPSNATVMQKGKVIAPASEGVYSITVSIVDLVFTVQADGYEAQQFVVNLKSPKQMKIDLKPNRKEVSVTTDPENAVIFVNGRESGQGVVDFTINKGETKTVKCVADGYDTFIKQIGFYDRPEIQMSYNIPLTQNRRDINVLVDVDAAEFYYDGKLVGKGKDGASFSIYKGKDAMLIIRADGYMEYSRMIYFSENVTSYNLTQDLSRDKSYDASEPCAEIANKRIEFMIKSSITREQAIQRMKFFITEAFGSLEINDNVSGWYRTIWAKEEYPSIGVIRTRIELKEVPDNGDGKLKYKFLLQSQIAYKSEPIDEDYKDWNRVLKKYAKLATDIRSLVGE